MCWECRDWPVCLTHAHLFVDAVGNQDFALTQQLVMLVVLVFVFTNLVVDIFYAWLDPRIRYS